jgi:uncharacterized protein (TIGR02996 family)
MTATIESTTFDALLATVCDYPGDPAPMLVLADWMDENWGHEAGRAMRWAAERGKRPMLYTDRRLLYADRRSWGCSCYRLEVDEQSWLPWFMNPRLSPTSESLVDAWTWFVEVFNYAVANGHV